MEGEFPTGEGLCFSLGSKIFIDDLQVESGGGGTNTACAFSNQGFKVGYAGMVGDDKRGEAVLEDLKKFKVDVSFIKKNKACPTAYSAVLSLPQRERTILLFRGACHFLGEKDIPWQKLKNVKWFYLAPLSGKSSEVFLPIVEFANKNNIKVAVNPGSSQLRMAETVLGPALKKIDVLILNKEEASFLTKISPDNEEGIIRKLRSFSKAIVVITLGKKGSLVSDKEYLYRAPAPNVLPVEKTGAGDAYGSGFVSGLLQKNNLKYAIQLATANATSCIQKVGAKNGLLKKGQWGKWPKVEVTKRLLA